MTTDGLNHAELGAWVRLAAVVERLPGVLDTQLRRDAELSLFEYQVLAMLSEAPKRTVRMTSLAALTNATLPRLSHVVSRLENRELVERLSAPDNTRATDVKLTPHGWSKVRASAPGHARTVRENVIDALTPKQIEQLSAIMNAILQRLDPDGTLAETHRRYDKT